ncbi:MAG: hypothetical protein KFF50_16010 [Desulfatitalea sp.]|nr:hypothetical protein [Desulfatitalea sp.]
MKNRKHNRFAACWRKRWRPWMVTGVLGFIVGLAVCVGLPSPGSADMADMADMSVPNDAMEQGLNHLMAFGASDSGGEGLDRTAIAPVLDYIGQAPELADYTPLERSEARGSFLAYTVDRPLAEVVRYVYNNRIPEGAANPSSIHYAHWTAVDGTPGRALPDIWEMLDSVPAPTVVRGVSREIIAPDLYTGTYYQYDLRRAIVLFRNGSQRVVISLSKQMGPSEVGRKGLIVGDDKDWNYLYTEDEGVNKAGLGWVKSRIYEFLSICIYMEDDTRPGAVKVGVFQWLGAGWAGFNMVDTHHIRNGLERYAVQFKAMMTSPDMPAPESLEHLHHALAQTDEGVLRATAYDVIRHIHSLAQQGESARERRTAEGVDPRAYVDGLSRDELVTVIMREFVKHRLGKASPLEPAFWVALKANGGRPKPL